MELLTAVASKAADFGIKPVVRHTSYIFCYKRKVENLEHKIKDLKAARERVQFSVSAATRNGEEILENVRNWHELAGKFTEEPVKKDSEDGECSFWLFTDLKSRYEFSKKADKEVAIIGKLLEEEGRFRGKVSHPVDPQEIWATSSKSYMHFDSRKYILSEILVALRDANLKTIGVYGAAGIGKTTLVKEVAREAKAEKLFDVVVLAVVSQMRDVKEIQSEIADFLGLKFDEQSVAGRANRLRVRLWKEKKILVILDDIRTCLKLQEIGIWLGDLEHGGCKVLLTSRDPKVLAERNAEKLLRVDVLQEEEAWMLFKKMAGDFENPEVQSAAMDACKRCGGLPISIVTTAKAFKNANLSEWEKCFATTKSSFSTMLIDPLSAIQLSFNHLANEDLKAAFLLMPYNDTIFDLLKYVVAFGLLLEITTMEEARQRLQRLIQNLKSSRSLLDGSTTEEFAMDDVIIATEVASMEKTMFFMRNAIGPRELPDVSVLRNLSAISLLYNDFIKLPDKLECPLLKCFQLYNKNPALKISDRFFMKTKALKVLDLKGMQLLSLPSSLGSLEDLRTLCLESCLLQDIKMVAKLKKLKILSFDNSTIEELPEEIGELTQLKLLNLDNCSNLRVIPQNAISNLSQLEELYIGNSSAKWDVDELRSRHANLDELKQLPDLSSLHLHLDSHNNMSKELPLVNSLEQLVHLEISDCKLKEEILAEKRGEDMTEKILFPKLNLLKLKGLPEMTRFCSSKRDEFPSLKQLHIEHCPKLATFVFNMKDTKESIQPLFNEMVAFPSLEKMRISHLKSLVMLWNNQLHEESFCRLKTLEVECCEELQNIFPSNIVARFQRLEKLYMSNLPKLKHVWSEDPQGIITFKNLNFVYAFACHSLQNLFPASIATNLHKLQRLEIDACAVEEIVAKNETYEQDIRFAFPELSFMRLWNLQKLKSFYPGLHSTEWPALKNFVSYHCGDLKIFNSELLNSKKTCRVSQSLFLVEKVVQKLEEISVNSDDISILSREVLPGYLFRYIKALRVHCYHQEAAIFPFGFIQKFLNLEKLYVGCCKFRQLITSSFSNLKELQVWNCNEVEKIFASSTANTLKQLTKLSIRKCIRVMEIVADEREEETTEEIIFHNLVYLELNQLPNLLCFSSGNYALKFPSLEGVAMKQCPNMLYFSWRELSTSKLHKVWLTEEKDQSSREGDLNAIVGRSRPGKVGCFILNNRIII